MNFLLSARVLIFNIPILNREQNKFQHKTYSQQFYLVLYKHNIGVMVGIQVMFSNTTSYGTNRSFKMYLLP